MGDMRRGVVGLLLVLAGLAVAPYPSSPAAGGCVSPQLSIAGKLSSRQSPVELRRGDEVTVDGRFFHDGCDDTGGGDAFGCSTDEPEPEPPQQDVELVLLEKPADPEGVSLSVADADEEANATWTFTVPTDAPLGRGILRAGTSSDLYVLVS